MFKKPTLFNRLGNAFAVVCALAIGATAAPPPERPSGRLLYQTEYPSERFHIRDLATDAITTVELPPMGNGYYNPQWCPTGEWITFMCADVLHNTQICVSRPDGSEFAQITTGSGNFVTPGFSGDCSRIVFHGVYGHTYVIDRDGSNWTDLGVWLGHTRWSPVDNWIAGTDWGFTYESDIFIFDMDEGTTTQITHHPSGGYFNYAYWSPDGAKLAVAGGIHGATNEIFLMNSDGTGLVNLTGDWSGTDKGWPSWSSDGNFIIFTAYAPGIRQDTWAMRPEGTGRVNLTNTPDQDEYAPAITGGSAGDCSPVCGNNVVEALEECDDGGNIDADGCSSTCEVEDAPDFESDVLLDGWLVGSHDLLTVAQDETTVLRYTVPCPLGPLSDLGPRSRLCGFFGKYSVNGVELWMLARIPSDRTLKGTLVVRTTFGVAFSSAFEVCGNRGDENLIPILIDRAVPIQATPPPPLTEIAIELTAVGGNIDISRARVLVRGEEPFSPLFPIRGR